MGFGKKKNTKKKKSQKSQSKKTQSKRRIKDRRYRRELHQVSQDSDVSSSTEDDSTTSDNTTTELSSQNTSVEEDASSPIRRDQLCSFAAKRHPDGAEREGPSTGRDKSPCSPTPQKKLNKPHSSADERSGDGAERAGPSKVRDESPCSPTPKKKLNKPRSSADERSGDGAERAGPSKVRDESPCSPTPKKKLNKPRSSADERSADSADQEEPAAGTRTEDTHLDEIFQMSRSSLDERLAAAICGTPKKQSPGRPFFQQRPLGTFEYIADGRSSPAEEIFTYPWHSILSSGVTPLKMVNMFLMISFLETQKMRTKRGLPWGPGRELVYRDDLAISELIRQLPTIVRVTTNNVHVVFFVPVQAAMMLAIECYMLADEFGELTYKVSDARRKGGVLRSRHRRLLEAISALFKMAHTRQYWRIAERMEPLQIQLLHSYRFCMRREYFCRAREHSVYFKRALFEPEWPVGWEDNEEVFEVELVKPPIDLSRPNIHLLYYSPYVVRRTSVAALMRDPIPNGCILSNVTKTGMLDAIYLSNGAAFSQPAPPTRTGDYVDEETYMPAMDEGVARSPEREKREEQLRQREKLDLDIREHLLNDIKKQDQKVRELQLRELIGPGRDIPERLMRDLQKAAPERRDGEAGDLETLEPAKRDGEAGDLETLEPAKRDGETGDLETADPEIRDSETDDREILDQEVRGGETPGREPGDGEEDALSSELWSLHGYHLEEPRVPPLQPHTPPFDDRDQSPDTGESPRRTPGKNRKSRRSRDVEPITAPLTNRKLFESYSRLVEKQKSKEKPETSPETRQPEEAEAVKDQNLSGEMRQTGAIPKQRKTDKSIGADDKKSETPPETSQPESESVKEHDLSGQIQGTKAVPKQSKTDKTTKVVGKKTETPPETSQPKSEAVKDQDLSGQIQRTEAVPKQCKTDKTTKAVGKKIETPSSESKEPRLVKHVEPKPMPPQVVALIPKIKSKQVPQAGAILKLDKIEKTTKAVGKKTETPSSESKEPRVAKHMKPKPIPPEVVALIPKIKSKQEPQAEAVPKQSKTADSTSADGKKSETPPERSQPESEAVKDQDLSEQIQRIEAVPKQSKTDKTTEVVGMKTETPPETSQSKSEAVQDQDLPGQMQRTGAVPKQSMIDKSTQTVEQIIETSSEPQKRQYSQYRVPKPLRPEVLALKFGTKYKQQPQPLAVLRPSKTVKSTSAEENKSETPPERSQPEEAEAVKEQDLSGEMRQTGAIPKQRKTGKSIGADDKKSETPPETNQPVSEAVKEQDLSEKMRQTGAIPKQRKTDDSTSAEKTKSATPPERSQPEKAEAVKAQDLSGEMRQTGAIPKRRKTDETTKGVGENTETPSEPNEPESQYVKFRSLYINIKTDRFVMPKLTEKQTEVMINMLGTRLKMLNMKTKQVLDLRWEATMKGRSWQPPEEDTETE